MKTTPEQRTIKDLQKYAQGQAEVIEEQRQEIERLNDTAKGRLKAIQELNIKLTITEEFREKYLKEVNEGYEREYQLQWIIDNLYKASKPIM